MGERVVVFKKGPSQNRARKLKARVVGSFNGRICEATVIIDTPANLITVRPLKSRRIWVAPLVNVVERMVLDQVVSEAAAKRAERRRRRR